jgi:hypothetical protein
MSPQLERLLLRAAVGLLALVPILAGAAGILFGGTMTGASPGDAGLDSHVRYLSGLLLAIGLGFWSTLPDIERQGPRFQLLTFLVVVGGLARLLGVALVGWPSYPMLGGLGMELAVTPLLCWWQLRFSRRFLAADDTAR